MRQCPENSVAAIFTIKYFSVKIVTDAQQKNKVEIFI